MILHSKCLSPQDLNTCSSYLYLVVRTTYFAADRRQSSRLSPLPSQSRSSSTQALYSLAPAFTQSSMHFDFESVDELSDKKRTSKQKKINSSADKNESLNLLKQSSTKEYSNFALAGWRNGWTRRGFQNRKMGSRKKSKGSCKLTNQSLTRVGFRKI